MAAWMDIYVTNAKPRDSKQVAETKVKHQKCDIAFGALVFQWL